MPTYDYKCNACGHAFDELQSFSEPVLTRCPKCKKNKLERLFGGGGAIIFKGGGFYETDYRRAGEKVDAGEPAPAAESKDTKAETPAAPAADKPAKAETKSASKGGGTKKKGK
jgi:putative FmdB family regulatory protein